MTQPCPHITGQDARLGAYLLGFAYSEIPIEVGGWVGGWDERGRLLYTEEIGTEGEELVCRLGFAYNETPVEKEEGWVGD